MNHRSVRNGCPLSDQHTNLAREARLAGYEPLLFGYTDTSLDPRSRPADDPALKTYENPMPEFTEKIEMRSGASHPWRSDLADKGYTLPDYSHFYHPVAPSLDRPVQINDPAFYCAADSDTAFLTDAALAEIASHTNENWLIHLTYIRPHPPLVAPAPYNTLYPAEALPLPVRHANRQLEAAVHEASAALLQFMKLRMQVQGFDALEETDSNIQTLRAIYLGLATEVDTHIGRLIGQLKQSGEYDNTLIILTSDHGEMLGDHWMWGKHTVYDAAYHIPLIIRDPQHPDQHGAVVAQYSETVDITPTILDWIGQTIPQAMNGRSLLGLLRGEHPQHWREHVFMELDLGNPLAPSIWQHHSGTVPRQANVAMLRDRHYKLVHFNGGIAPLLFDIVADPAEMHNLAHDPACMPVLLDMTRKLLDHRMTFADHALTDYQVTAAGTVLPG